MEFYFAWYLFIVFGTVFVGIPLAIIEGIRTPDREGKR